MANSYTGDAFNVTIPKNYKRKDFKHDTKTCREFILALENDDEDECIRILLENPEVEFAFGRATAYAERKYRKKGLL